MITMIPLKAVRKSALRLVVIVLGCMVVGCKSSPSQYVSPRVTGRVLDASTHLPIENAKVRLLKQEPPNVATPKKGGQVLQEPPAIRTAGDGTFDLAGRKSLRLFSRIGWYSVGLSFEHPDFRRYVTNYSIADAVKSPKGEPLVKAGDILLYPAKK